MFLLMVAFITAIESKLGQKGIFENSDFFICLKDMMRQKNFSGYTLWKLEFSVSNRQRQKEESGCVPGTPSR